MLRKVFQLIDCTTLKVIHLECMEMEDKLVDVLLDYQFNKLEDINLGIKVVNKDNSAIAIGDKGLHRFVTKDWSMLRKIDLSK